MKRNETILVYAVTGLLLVILLVAVLFGESKPLAGDPTKDQAPVEVVVLPGVSPVNPPKQPAEVPGPVASDDQRKSKDPAGSDPATTDKANQPVAGTGKDAGTTPAVGTAGSGAAQSAVSGPVDLNAKKVTEKVVTAEMRLEEVLGTSRRMDDFRVVKSRRGDTLLRLVERWCVDARLLPDAEAVNETLVDRTLPANQEVVVPWVEADAILAARTARAAAAAKAEAAKGELYALRKGDSLWKLGKSRVGKSQLVPAWIERFKQLNPEITDPSVLVVGQKVRLPR